jgi:hypothetical protein
MSEAEISKLTEDLFTDHQPSEDEVRLAARKAFTFLSACVDGQVEDAKVGDRIMAAKTLLEYSAKVPGLMGELADLAGLASEEDLAVIATVLE